MILWHLGVTLLIVRYVFRDSRMDLRWVLLGSLLPDLIDKPIGSLLFNDTFETDRLFAHAILFPVVGLFVALAVGRRGTVLRRALIGVVIGSLMHLILDAAWADPEAFWWPLFGFDFPVRPDSGMVELLGRMVRSPLVWAGEAVGLAYLVYLWRTYLQDPDARQDALRAGRVAMPRP